VWRRGKYLCLRDSVADRIDFRRIERRLWL
jgi:hypothetical protein